MKSNIAPFRLLGNLYFVGTFEASSHLLDTGDGLILIDTGFDYNAETVLDSINELGFSAADIKVIIHSHGHRDHTGATAQILKHCSAKTYLNFKDKKYLKDFTPDFDMKDGDIIKLGDAEILCLYTPGHTEGTMSFFFNLTEDGKTYRAGTFGGAGTNQLKKAYMRMQNINYLYRGEFYKSIERLKGERVDVFIGNHSWQNNTREKAEILKQGGENPFIDSTLWERFLNKLSKALDNVIADDIKNDFVNYAHRGASQYRPENTMISFRLGLEQGANGIETDVHITKDGVAVLFHDDTVDRVTNGKGDITEFTYDELLKLDVIKDEYKEKIPTFREFLDEFSKKDITFAIELKQKETAEAVIDMLREYELAPKTVITSFYYDELLRAKAYGDEFRFGHLTKDISAEHTDELIKDGISEICPMAKLINENKGLVAKWHALGLNVRAWGISDEHLMKSTYDEGVDGMTVNFPDKLTEYINEKRT